MNRILIFLLFQAVCSGILMAQSGRPAKSESMLPGQRGELNVRNAAYPRLLPGNRIEFKIKAPDAKKVQIDLGRKYDLVRNADGDGVVLQILSRKVFITIFLLLTEYPLQIRQVSRSMDVA